MNFCGMGLGFCVCNTCRLLEFRQGGLGGAGRGHCFNLTVLLDRSMAWSFRPFIRGMIGEVEEHFFIFYGCSKFN